MERHVLYNAHGLLLLCTGVAVALLYRTVQTDKRDPTALWIAATTFSGGFGLLILSGAHRWPLLSVGCMLFLATPSLLHVAIGSAARESIRRTLPWAVGLSIAGVLLHASTGSLAVALLPVPAVEALSMWLLLRDRRSVTRMANLAMAVFLAIHIVSFSYRIHIVALRRPSLGFMAFGGMLTIVGLGVSFVSMEALRSRHDFERMAMTDALTGLLNRRALELMAPRELQRCARKGKPCTALMLDIDRFKEINDTMGHAAGDASLCAIAGVLQSLSRQDDIVTRLGGDEFFVLLPQCDEHDAAVIVAHLRQAIAACTLTTAGSKRFLLEASIGVATLHSTELTVQDLLHASDVVLYQEKLRSRPTAETQPAGTTAADGAHVQPSSA